ncbi:hypothetical protein IE53DRAFT_390356 [Violaceomyces palustris]|uniref:Uncharacterized protein n=1 Tax=Violaceomyces palustris TaxID=1673888 RepID=A0ACD0NNV3_9BASI|nr:hypothetical protein IE53DRAFT_390356 [Violaceomyces palustris]
MSLDLDWSLLDDQLSERLLETLNRALQSSSSKRPSFLGEITISGLEFGSHAPELVIKNITDTWSDFTGPHDPNLHANLAVATTTDQGGQEGGSRRNSSSFQHQNASSFPGRRSNVAAPSSSAALVSQPNLLPLRTYTQYHDDSLPQRIQGPPSVMSASTPGGGTPQQWSTALASRGLRHSSASSIHSFTQALANDPPNQQSLPSPVGYFSHWQQIQQQQQQQQHHQSLPPPTIRQNSFDEASSFSPIRGGGGSHRQFTPTTFNSGGNPRSGGGGGGHRSSGPSFRSHSGGPGAFLPTDVVGGVVESEGLGSDPFEGGGGVPNTSSSSSSLPSLQLHFSLYWPSTTFRLTIKTSLLINYPSPAFMSLPLQVSVTGFVMRAGVVLALEGEKRRAHICLTEDEEEQAVEEQGFVVDPNPVVVSAEAQRGPDVPTTNQTFRIASQVKSPSILGGKHEARGLTSTSVQSHYRGGQGFHNHSLEGGLAAGGATKVTPGTKILPSLSFESEVGQADKHALKNVGKVEKFIAECLRKGIEDELVFPNFYTIDLPK